MSWPTDDYDVFTDPVSDTPLSGPHRSTTVVAAIHSALRALQRKVGYDLDGDTLTIDSQMRLHGHPHTLLEASKHTDASGATPADGQVMTRVVDEDAGIAQWTSVDLPTNDHGTLPGLLDDDHPQYAEAAHGHLAEGILDNRTLRSHFFNNISGVTARCFFIAPWACRVRAVRTFRHGGTSASVTARVNGTTSVLGADIVTATDGAVSDETPDFELDAGDYVEAQVTAISGASSIFVQLDIERV